jgi:hypothetical protein
MTVQPDPTASADPESALVAGLLAWEQLFGRKPLSWGELRDLGLSLSPAEARLYLDHRLPDPRRQGLYRTLFASHPELQAYIDRRAEAEIDAILRSASPRARRSPLAHQFIARLTPRGGPDPELELTELLRRGGVTEGGTAWFPTRSPGGKWRLASGPAESICLLFHLPGSGGVDAVLAQVLGRSEEMPADDALQAFYGADIAYGAWWQLAQLTRFQLTGLDQIPGRSANGKTASEAFTRARLSFVFWNFGMPLADIRGQLLK